MSMVISPFSTDVQSMRRLSMTSIEISYPPRVVPLFFPGDIATGVRKRGLALAATI